VLAAVLASVVRDLHVAWSWVVVISNVGAGLWALGAHWRAALRVRALWPFVAAAEVSIFVAAALGAGVVGGDGIEAPELHLFYGVLAIVGVGILYSYRSSSPWVGERLHLVYGLGGLFIAGLCIRAMVLQR
jgi:hypothetical protein